MQHLDLLGFGAEHSAWASPGARAEPDTSAALRAYPNLVMPAGDLRAAGDHAKEYKPVAATTAAAETGGSGSTQEAPLGPVLWAVSIASCGALAFGYHLGVVNGPLNAIAADLGFAGNAGLQGTVGAPCDSAARCMHAHPAMEAAVHASMASRLAPGITVAAMQAK